MRRMTIFVVIICLSLLWSLPAGAANYADISNHWAEQDIARLNARGLVSGKAWGQFAPEQILTRQEAVAMLVRMSGQLTDSSLYSVAGYGKGVSSWAVSSLDQALQKGIINESELRVIDWGAPAARAEMAVWLSKALKLTPIINDSEGIISIFKDGGLINSYQRPYIIPLVKNGLMLGSNGYFRPLDSLKRSEAAALINRADSRFPQSGGTKMERGQMVRVDTGYRIVLMVRDTLGIERSLVVTQQTGIYRSGKKITYKNLAAGQWLNYIVNGSQLVYAEIAGTTEFSTTNLTLPVLPTTLSVVGELEELNMTTGLVRVYSGGTQLSYRIGLFPSIYINAKVGDEVALTVQNGWVSSINAVKIDQGEDIDSDDGNSEDCVIYKATLDRLNSDDEMYLTSVYRLEDGRWRSRSSMYMDVKRNADIYYDGEEIDLEDLEDDYEGDTVYIAYDEDNDEAVTIRVKKGSEYNYYDDVVDSVSSSRLYLDDNNAVYGDDDVIVIEDGKLRDWQDIEEDDEVCITVNYTGGRYYAAVIEIMDSSNGSRTDDLNIYRGYIADIDTAEKELELGSVYYLGSSGWRSRSGSLWIEVPRTAEIYYQDDEIDLEDLEDDHDGETVYVAYDEDSEEALQIRVREDSEYVWSDVVESTSSSAFELEDQNKKIYYDDSTIVLHNNRLVNGSYIDEEDDVLVIAEWDGSTYRAVIVVIK